MFKYNNLSKAMATPVRRGLFIWHVRFKLKQEVTHQTIPAKNVKNTPFISGGYIFQGKNTQARSKILAKNEFMLPP